METKLLNLKGKEVGKVDLPEVLFSVKPDASFIHEVVKYYLANKHRGTACTKTRGEISGGGKKPWKQKGTGRARQGSSRASHWVGGGKAMGPKARDYTYRPPRTVRRGALRSALSLRAGEKSIIIVSEFPSDGKSKKAAEVLKKGLKLTDALIVDEKKNDKLLRAVRNLAKFDVAPVEGVTVESVLKRKSLVLTVAAAKAINDALVKSRANKAKA